MSIFSFDDLLVVDWSIIFHSIWELNLYFLGSHGRGFSSNSSQEFFFRIWLVFIQFQLMLWRGSFERQLNRLLRKIHRSLERFAFQNIDTVQSNDDFEENYWKKKVFANCKLEFTTFEIKNARYFRRPLPNLNALGMSSLAGRRACLKFAEIWREAKGYPSLIFYWIGKNWFPNLHLRKWKIL